MEKSTIQPLQKLSHTPGKYYLTPPELAELTAQIKKKINIKARQRHSATIEEYYLKILTEAPGGLPAPRQNFTPGDHRAS